MTPPDIPVGAVIITSKEIYEAVVNLTGRVDVLIAQQAEASKDITDHETRIRALERARWPLPSLAAVLSLVALAITVIPKL